MKTKNIRVRYLKSLNSPKWLNHFKLSVVAYLGYHHGILVIKGNRIYSEIHKIVEISDVSLGGLHFESWVKIDFDNQFGKNQILYILNGDWFTFDYFISGNKKIVSLLKNEDRKSLSF